MRRMVHGDASARKQLAAASLGSMTCRMCGAGSLRHLLVTGHRRLVECAECAFVFAAHPRQLRPGQTRAQTESATVREHASALNVRAPGEAYVRPWKPPELVPLAPVWQFLPEQQTLHVLDYGAGAPQLSEALRRLGHRVVEVELTSAEAAFGLDAGRRRRVERTQQRFDLIYSFHVFEHLVDPRLHLDRLLALAGPGAPILIETEMHASDHMPRLLRGACDDAHPPCAFFGHRTFARVLADTPHRIAWADRHRIVIRAWMGTSWPVPIALAADQSGLRSRSSIQAQ
jgi:SAM-dependent methyltransferase